MNLMMFAPLSWRGARCTSSCSSNRRVIRYLGFIFWGVFLFVFFRKLVPVIPHKTISPPEELEHSFTHLSWTSSCLGSLVSISVLLLQREREREGKKAIEGALVKLFGFPYQLWRSIWNQAACLSCLSAPSILPFELLFFNFSFFFKKCIYWEGQDNTLRLITPNCCIFCVKSWVRKWQPDWSYIMHEQEKKMQTRPHRHELAATKVWRDNQPTSDHFRPCPQLIFRQTVDEFKILSLLFQYVRTDHLLTSNK